MKCSFCGKTGENFDEILELVLCEDCLRQLLMVSPKDLEYDWFVRAVRRNLIA